MKLSDLKTGMHVILRDGSEYIVLKDTCLCLFYDTYGKNIIKNLNGKTYTSLDNYNEDFINADGFKILDIVEVYTCDCVSSILESVTFSTAFRGYYYCSYCGSRTDEIEYR